MIQDERKNKHNDIQGLKKQSSELLNCAWEKGYVAGFNDGYATRREADKRTHGMALIRSNLDMSNYYICSECRRAIDFQDNFCRNCGADMREDGTE